MPMSGLGASIAALGVVLWANLSPLMVDQPADGPGLSCGIRLAPARPGDAPSTTFTCWATGAPAGDTSFTAQVFRTGADGTLQAVDSASAEGALSDGAGVCTIQVNDLPGSPLLAGFVVAGTFQPSGTQIGPMRISPTI